MARRVVYGVGLGFFLISMALTLASMILPTWITWDTPTSHTSYGLHSHCTSLAPIDIATTSMNTAPPRILYSKADCRPFPSYSDCRSSTTSKHFCTWWRSAAFLSSLSFILALATTTSFIVVILGGKQKRMHGWKLVTGLVLLTEAAQIATAVIVATMLETEERFKSGGVDGWHIGKGWWAAFASAVIQMCVALGIIIARGIMEEEGGYELIPDDEREWRPRRERDQSGGWARW
ncbi:MAG: hypothetical protein M1828_007661 [Chrysothrix sp. TS-e1954]|nr:MAG: hypothetical protein M1828_007661 [Chrysothrix sp. TS-e1954]